MEKQKKKFKPMLILVIISILLVPSFYGFTYLKAFWNPYHELQNVPVAFVNEDQSVVQDGKTYDIGQSVENTLKSNNSVKWQFVSYQDALAGVNGNKYYAMIVIPKDFSKDLADATTDGFKKPQMIYKVNQGRNFVFSEISQQVAQEVQISVSQQISQATSEVLVNSLYTAKTGFEDATNGSKGLASGIDKLASGSNQLMTGASALNTGLNQLNGTLTQQNGPATQLESGATALSSGANQLSNGTDKLTDGAKQLNSGITELKNAVVASSSNTQKSLNAAASGIDNVSSAVDKAQALLAEANANIQAGKMDKQTMVDLQTASAILSKVKENNISQTIAAPLASNANSMQPLVENLSKLQGGSQQLVQASQQISSGASAIASNTTKLTDGTKQLISGVSAGVSKLADGSNQLTSGVKAVNSGLESANSGASKLSSALESGYKSMTSSLTFTPEAMSSFISNPVNLTTENINYTPLYGEGLAPYFVCISLWMGSMYAYFVITAIAKKFTDKFTKKYLKVYAIGFVASLIQGALMSLVLYFGLNMNTGRGVEFFLFNELVALTFFTVIYAMHQLMAPIMKGAVIVVFVLQLTSCAGIYPIETAPLFYRILHPIVPMTYAVNGIRMTVSGINYSEFIGTILSLVAFIVGGLIVGYIIGLIKTETHRRIEAKKSELVSEEEVFNEFV